MLWQELCQFFTFLGKEEKQRTENKSTNDCLLWQMDGLQRKIISLLRIYSGHQYLKCVVRSGYHFLNGESFLSNGFFSTFSKKTKQTNKTTTTTKTQHAVLNQLKRKKKFNMVLQPPWWSTFKLAPRWVLGQTQTVGNVL